MPFVDIGDNGNTVDLHPVTWFDSNDAATSVTPISHLGGAVNTYLTNDSLGPFSNAFNPKGITNVWDSGSNHFDFSNLKIGDWLHIRVDTDITHSAANQEFEFYFDMAIGSAGPYSLKAQHCYHKSIGTDQVTFLYSLYVGDTNTRDFPCKIRFESDDNASIVVRGWWTALHLS